MLSNFVKRSPFDGSGSSSSGGESASGAKPFYRSMPSVKSAVLQKDQQIQRATYEICKAILEDPGIVPGKTKLHFIPREGEKTLFISDTLDIGDLMGLWPFEGTHNGRKISIVTQRRKHGDSVVHKRIQELGGSPYVKIEDKHAQLETSIKFLREATEERSSFGPEQKEELGSLLGAAIAEREGRKALLKIACGGAETSLRNLHYYLTELGGHVSKLAKAEAELEKSYSQCCSDPVDKLLGAAAMWPVPSRESENFCAAVPAGKQQELLKWSKDYALRIMPRVFGVEILEYTSRNTLEELILLLNHVYVGSGRKQNHLDVMASFDVDISALLGKIDAADAELKRMKTWSGSDASRWFAGVCNLAERRSKILEKIKEIEGKVSTLPVSGQHRRLISLLLSNMAVNLCRVSESEKAAWDSLLNDKYLKPLLHSGKAGKAYIPAIKKFVSASKSEIKEVGEILGNVRGRKEEFKATRKKIEADMFTTICKIKGASEPVGRMLHEVYSARLGHLNYKQKEHMSPFIEDAYCSRLSLINALRGSPHTQGAEYAWEKAAQDTAYILHAILRDRQISEEMSADLSSHLYMQRKGFDAEIGTQKIKEGKFNDDPMEVQYWLTTGKDKNGNDTNILNIEFSGRQRQIELGRLPYDEGYSPHAYDSVGSGKPDENIFGRKYSFSEIVPDYEEGEGIENIFLKMYKAEIESNGTFEKVKRKLAERDMESAHFLYTLSEPEHYSGVVAKGLGNGREGDGISRNMPLGLSELSDNSYLEELKREYPSFESDALEVEKYLVSSIRRRVLQRIITTLPYYLEKYLHNLVPNRQ